MNASRQSFKILSWNVNGIRAILRKFSHSTIQPLLEKLDCDVICFQETKLSIDSFDNSLLSHNGWLSYWSVSTARKGYSGVATFIRSDKSPIKVVEGIGHKDFDSEGRVLRTDIGDNTCLFNVYFPNGGQGAKRLDFKMDFYNAFKSHIEKLREDGMRVIVVGDVNTALMDIDVHDPKRLSKHTGFLPSEREWLQEFFDHGWADSFRHIHGNKEGCYTFWDMKTSARQRNAGWRIDYAIYDARYIKEDVLDCSHFTEQEGSDHCPVILTLNQQPKLSATAEKGAVPPQRTVSQSSGAGNKRLRDTAPNTDAAQRKITDLFG